MTQYLILLLVAPTLGSLFTMAGSFSQVERCTALVREESQLFDVPCISPLQAEDIRHLSISSRYGQRLHPITNEYKHHSGIDLPAKNGDKVHATANGIVEKVSSDAITGRYIKLRHHYGFTTLYGHLSQQLVTTGDTVRIGNIIGLVGSTGRSTGPHLHYGIVKNDKQQDPLPYCYLYLHWAMQHVEK